MIRIINYLYIFLFIYIVTYVKAYRYGILGEDSFNTKVTQSCPTNAVCKSVESKYFSLSFKETYILYKIITDVDFSEFDTFTIEYYLVTGQGQLLLLDTNTSQYVVLDEFSVKKKWLSYTYKIPRCSNFNAIAIKNIKNLGLYLKHMAVTNSNNIDIITSDVSTDYENWSWSISGYESFENYTYVESMPQYTGFSLHYLLKPYHHDFIEFDIKETYESMELAIATENCGSFPYLLERHKPVELDDGWYRYHIPFDGIYLNCNIDRYTFMNRGVDPVSITIKNFYVGTNKINETEIVNIEKSYECEEIIEMVSIFDENEEIVWGNISKDVDHILYQPNRILAYDINPDGYLSFKSDEEYLNPLLIEMEVLASFTHWTIELLDKTGKMINRLVLDNSNLSMNTWAVVRLPFEMERKGKESFNTFKIYHDSSKSENFIIRTMAFHYYNPPIDSSLIFEESCCPVKFCSCEVIYETVYVDDDFVIPEDEDDDDENRKEKRFYIEENIEEEEEEEDDDEYDDEEKERNGDIQKRSLLNKIGSFLNNLNLY